MIFRLLQMISRILYLLQFPGSIGRNARIVPVDVDLLLGLTIGKRGAPIDGREDEDETPLSLELGRIDRRVFRSLVALALRFIGDTKTVGVEDAFGCPILLTEGSIGFGVRCMLPFACNED
uniref:Secreted protein n=1 Tax=Glossina austeni TaxID=7395 RepID=A0A1A9UV31_GLOAU